MIKYIDYLNNNESLFKFSKEYADEESCIYQLISNKKNDFLNFFTDFFMDLPGFMTIYKDKFFSKIKDFIDDKNYIFSLKDKFTKKYNENKNSEKEDDKTDYLGIKRKRNKDNALSAYDTELKLLESDYPQIIENGDEFFFENVQIKKEKINEDEIINNEINIENTISTNKEKEIQAKIENESVNKSKKRMVIKFASKKKQQNKNETTSKNASKNKKEKSRNIMFEKIDFNSIFTQTKTVSYNNIVNNNIDSSMFSDYPMSVIKEKSPNPINMFYGINSRLDKMPKINIHKKKKRQTNYSAERLIQNIRNKLTSIGRKNKIHGKRRYLSDDKKRREEMQNLSQIVNNNFYGKERLKSPDYIKNNANEIICENNENTINCENKEKNIKNPKKKKLIKRKNITNPPVKDISNKNVSILDKIILKYENKKGEKVITKSEFIPEYIIIDKSAISINEIRSIFNSMFKKENKDKDNKKNKDYIHNPKELKQKKSKKNPKKKIKKADPIIKPRKSKRIQQLQKAKKEREKENQRLKIVEKLRQRRRTSKKFIKRNKKINPKKEIINKASENKSIRFDSLAQSNLSNMGKIRTNYENYVDNDDNIIKNGYGEILVNKTNCDDYLSNEDRFLSNRRRTNGKPFNNNTVTSDNLDDFDALKGFNYLYNQKK